MKNWIRPLVLSCMLHSMGMTGSSAQQLTSEKAADFLTTKLTDTSMSRSLPEIRVRWSGKDVPGSSRTEGKSSYTYYAFDIGNGFAIVGGTDDNPELVAYSLQYKLPEAEHLPQPFMDWLAALSGYKQGDNSASSRSTGNGEKPETVVLLETPSWGQGTPFNSQVPLDDGVRSLAGCVPVAFSIIMKYYNWPEHGIGYISPYTTMTKKIQVEKRDLEIPYDYESMPFTYKYMDDESQWESVARLIADVGAACTTDYTYASSRAFVSEYLLMRRFRYNPEMKWYKRNEESDSTWTALIKSELDKGQPIIYTANSEANGHAFILDGYDSENRVHVNWGWAGDCNGFFSLDHLGVWGRLYDRDHEMLLDVTPNRHVNTVGPEEFLQESKFVFDKKEREVIVAHPKHIYTTVIQNGEKMQYATENWRNSTVIQIDSLANEPFQIVMTDGMAEKTIHVELKKHK